MNDMEMTVLLNKMILFIVLMLIGYYLVKRRLLPPDFIKVASKLVIDVFMIGTILGAMITTGSKIDLETLPEILLLVFVTEIIGFTVAGVVTRFVKLEQSRIYAYEILMGLGNNMFIALPIAGALYGDYAVFIVSVSCIPFNVLLYSYGVWKLSGGSVKQKFNYREMLSAPLIATIVGILIILFRIPMPTVIQEIFTSLGAVTMPMSMIVIGASLGNVSLLDAFRQKSLALLSITRLLMIPVITWGVCRFLTSNPVLLMTCMIIGGAPSAVIVSVMAIQYHQDGVFSSEAVQHSTICSVVTLPLLIRIFSSFC